MQQHVLINGMYAFTVVAQNVVELEVCAMSQLCQSYTHALIWVDGLSHFATPFFVLTLTMGECNIG